MVEEGESFQQYIHSISSPKIYSSFFLSFSTAFLTFPLALFSLQYLQLFTGPAVNMPFILCVAVGQRLIFISSLLILLLKSSAPAIPLSKRQCECASVEAREVEQDEQVEDEAGRFSSDMYMLHLLLSGLLIVIRLFSLALRSLFRPISPAIDWACGQYAFHALCGCWPPT
jgi:hypothetical protein